MGGEEECSLGVSSAIYSSRMESIERIWAQEQSPDINITREDICWNADKNR